jgi:hypothetical protein
MNLPDPVFEDEMLDNNDWPALAWIVCAAMVAVAAFLVAPLP